MDSFPINIHKKEKRYTYTMVSTGSIRSPPDFHLYKDGIVNVPSIILFFTVTSIVILYCTVSCNVFSENFYCSPLYSYCTGIICCTTVQ